MTRCPYCGSASQPEVIKTEYIEDGWEIKVIRTYGCGCGCIFTGISFYYCEDAYESIGFEN